MEPGSLCVITIRNTWEGVVGSCQAHATTRVRKKKMIRLHETTQENDIRYRGPLTAQHFKILGWICIVIAQIAVILRLGGHLTVSQW